MISFFLIPVRRRLDPSCYLFEEGNYERFNQFIATSILSSLDHAANSIDDYKNSKDFGCFSCNHVGCKQAFRHLTEVSFQ